MLPAIVALIVGISLGAYLIELLDDLGEFKDPHGNWMVDDDEEE